MPVHRTPDGGWQWGTHGHVYHGPHAREQAYAQAAAAEHAGYKEPDKQKPKAPKGKK